MSALQKYLESMFCPILDPALISVIIEDYKDFDACFEKLTILAEEAHRVLELECESESSENGSGNYKSYSSEPSSVYENGDGSVTSFGFMDEFDSESKGDEMLSDEEIERKILISPEGELTAELFKEFLKGCFPTHSETKIKSLIKENNDAGVILEKLLEVQQKESTYSYTPSSPLGYFTLKGDDDDENSSLVSKSRFKHRKKKRLRTPIQVDSHIPEFNFSTSNDPIPKAPLLSPWNAQWPPLEPTKPSSWDTQWPPLPSSISTEKKKSIDKLSEIFPDHDFQSLKAALETVGGAEESAVELLLGTSNVADNRVYSNEPSRIRHNPFLPSRVETEEYRVVRPKRNSNPIISRSTFSLNNVSPSAAFTRDENSSDDESSSDYEPKYCRQMADEFREKRNDAFRKAFKAWSKSHRSHNGDGGIASYYSTEGHKYAEEMEKWKSRAVNSMIRQKSKADDNLLDLHGLTVEEALKVVKKKLNQWHSKGMTKSRHTPTIPLKIITGVGKHSRNGVAKLPEAIDRHLNANNWNFSKHQGYVLVKGSKDH